MKEKKNIGIIGTSGFARETADICIALGYANIVFIGTNHEQGDLNGIPVIDELRIDTLKDQQYHFVIAIGDNQTRKKVADKLCRLKYVNLIHPSCTMGHQQLKYFDDATGNIMAAGVRLTNTIRPGNFGIFNLNATIGHDCIIEDFVNIAPGANISGNVYLKEGACIGTNAAVLQGKSLEEKIIIGNYAVVGAGAVVLEPVRAYDTVAGVPAISISKRRD